MSLSEPKPLMVDVKADLRERLIMVAIRLFAERGIEAVSMRTINAEAGTKNKSAVHYHFGNKTGILEAIFDWVKVRVEPVVTDLWRQLELREDLEEMSVQEILLILYTPLILVDRIPEHGRDILKLWSKIILDSYEDLPSSENLIETHMLAVLTLLGKKLPEKNREHLRFQITHSVFAFTAGTATLDSKILEGIENARFDNNLEMLFAFIDYVSGGISNTQSSVEKIDLEFWLNFFSKHNVDLN